MLYALFIFGLASTIFGIFAAGYVTCLYRNYLKNKKNQK